MARYTDELSYYHSSRAIMYVRNLINRPGVGRFDWHGIHVDGYARMLLRCSFRQFHPPYRETLEQLGQLAPLVIQDTHVAAGTRYVTVVLWIDQEEWEEEVMEKGDADARQRYER